MRNENLAIAIPTYNRAKILKENLLFILDDVKKYNIPIYISDDSSNTETENMINDLKKYYQYIYYAHNNPSLGHDKNCFSTLNMPKEKYIWYIGDSIVIEKGSLLKVLQHIKNYSYDFIITNHKDRNINIKSALLTNYKDLALQLGWHLTLTGATIYNRSTIKSYNYTGRCKNFPQTAIVLSSLPKNCNVYYDSDIITYTNKNKISYWSNDILNVFAYDWYEFIMSLPSFYSKDDKNSIIKSHSKHTGIFGLGALIKYKELKIITLRKYCQYYKYINTSSHINKYIIILVILSPTCILKTLKRYKKWTFVG